MNIIKDYSLYLVTNSTLLNGGKLEKAVEEAIRGGVTVVQLREKEISSRDFFNLAIKVKAITDKYNVPLIINDRIDIVLAIDSAGVHLGQNDLSCKIARDILPKGKIIGVSTHNLNEALKAEEEGATYLGCGAMFSTSTKEDASILEKSELIKIKTNISIPVVAIGGINEENISSLKGTNIDGVAVISAILGKSNIKNATKLIKEKIEKNLLL